MAQHLVSVLFAQEGARVRASREGRKFGFSEPQNSKYPAVVLEASAPVPRFTEMREQDLSIWTPTRLLQALAQKVAEPLRPAQLRPISILKDDHA